MLGWRICLGNPDDKIAAWPTFTVGSSGLADAWYRSPLMVIALLLCRYRTHDVERRVPLAILGDHTKLL